MNKEREEIKKKYNVLFVETGEAGEGDSDASDGPFTNHKGTCCLFTTKGKRVILDPYDWDDGFMILVATLTGLDEAALKEIHKVYKATSGYSEDED